MELEKRKRYMKIALIEAEKAAKIGEVPVGAVIVYNDEIIAKAHNMRENTNDPTAHAEVIAIKEASRKLDNWRLSGCELFVTLEPCPMCAGAIVQSRISKIHIGAFDPRAGACGTIMNITQNDHLNHWADVIWMYDQRCSDILIDFFKKRRLSNNEKKSNFFT